jgi:hypothetical protein
MLVKVQTGVQDVSPDSYLRQADEIFARGPAKTEGLTHPEAFIRARAVKLWAENDPEANTQIARMFAAPDESEAVIEREKSFYQVRDATESNPYLWNFDLCSLTLANLRYRRMSLVRDYEAILNQQLFQSAFCGCAIPAGRRRPIWSNLTWRQPASRTWPKLYQ